MKTLRVVAATPKVKVADVDWNVGEIVGLCKEIASEANPSIIVFPELSITGYTCGDLFFQKTLIDGAARGLKRLCEETAGLKQTIVVGLPILLDSMLLDAAVVIREGAVIGMVPKTHLTSDEARWFTSGPDSQLLDIHGVSVGISIGDTLILPSGAKLILCPAASSELAGKHARRKALLAAETSRLGAACVYSCSGYGESTDNVVWAGSSLIYAGGVKLAENERFRRESGWISADIDLSALHADPHAAFKPEPVDALDPHPFVPSDPALLEERCREIFNIQTTALMSRLEHIHCSKCVIGVSGGLDSTLALLVICEAFDRLGYDRKGVYAVTMPCFGTSDRTHSNAWKLMDGLGVTSMEIGIGDAVLQHFKDIGQDPSNHDVTYENSQARERTQVLMDLANKVGGTVIGTGDLSEIALGWCTYNGDHMSMYGVNADVPKTLIRAMVRIMAKGHACEDALIDIVETPVSPELVPGQVTENVVGPYELHDFFLVHFTRGETPSQILSYAVKAFDGTFTEEEIKRCLTIFLRRFFSQQFKRSCSPCAPQVFDVALSPSAWRMPTDANVNLWLNMLD